IAGDDTPALRSVLEADTERESLVAEEKALNAKLNKSSSTAAEISEANDRLKVVYQRMEDIEADKAESRASGILNGLGFSPAQQQAATKTFSGDILHLHSNVLDHYRGAFTNFVVTRAERRRNQIREYESQLQYRQHLQDFIDRWRYNAKRAAQSKIKILEKLPPLEAPPSDDMEGLGEGQETTYFRFPEPEKLSPPILQMTDVSFGYTSERIILKDISFDLRMDSKIAIVGPNGAGICQRHGRLRLALFSQHHVDQLELGGSSVYFLSTKFPNLPEEEYRESWAGSPIGTLSGGQKSRVVFAWMAMSNPHVLILDEPTNHLDMDSIDALAAALREFKGGLAIVSHDEQFLDAVCTEVWVCEGGGLQKFEGREGIHDGVVRQYKKSLLVDY
ncbi:P-loop containing nucleoside triphosphate hydrolase protein, partial [Entophlyctis helioformis]